MLLRITLISLAMALGFASAGCGAAATVEPPTPIELRVSTPAELAELARQSADLFAARQQYLSMEVTEGNASQSLNRLDSGNADLIFVLTPPANPDDYLVTPVARDGVAMIVHPENPVDNLTLIDLNRLYAGTVYNWRDVQGDNLDVQPVIRERGAGVNQIFSARVMNDDRITPNARVIPDSEAVVSFVAQNPGAIAFVSAGQADERVKIVSVEDVFPSMETVTSGAYPLAHLVYALTLPEPTADVKKLASFLLRPAGQEVVEQVGLGRIN